MLELLQDAVLAVAQAGGLDAAPAGTVSLGATAVGAAAQAPGILQFVSQSDWVGKSLFGFLILMSIATWYLIFVKAFLNLRTRRRSKRFLREFWAADSLAQIEGHLKAQPALEPFSRVAREAIQAHNRLSRRGTRLDDRAPTAAFVTRTIRKVIDEETAQLENGLTVLASVGSTAPFVGLFGTVWGVYHALVGIGMSEGVTVSRIAGPVGEALIMTGLGLAVAIPAVLAYNGFVRGNRVYLARLDAFAHELFTFLSTGPAVDAVAAPAGLGGNPDARQAAGL